MGHISLSLLQKETNFYQDKLFWYLMTAQELAKLHTAKVILSEGFVIVYPDWERKFTISGEMDGLLILQASEIPPSW